MGIMILSDEDLKRLNEGKTIDFKVYNTFGKPLASNKFVDIEMGYFNKFVDIEKGNFDPKMLKSCTDMSYDCGYQQGRKDQITELINTAHCDDADCFECAFGSAEKCLLKGE